MGAATVKDRVLKYLSDHPNVPVHRDDISKALDLTGSQVNSGVYALRQVNSLSACIEVIVTGRTWRYCPTGIVTNKRIFEEVGPARRGIIVQDEDGKLFLLEEL